MGDVLLDVMERWLRQGWFAEVRDALPDPEGLHGVERLRARLCAHQVALHFRQGLPDPEPARQTLELALQLGTLEQRARLSLGVTLFTAGALDDAEFELVRAQELDDPDPDPAIAARILAYLGLIKAHRRDLDAAAVVLRRASEALEAAGELREAAQRWQGLGNVLVWRGRTDEADEALERSERCAARYPAILADTLRSRTKITRLRGDLATTRALLEQGLAVVPDHRPVNRARLLNDLADLERLEGDLDRARELLSEALTIREGREDGINRVNLALVEVLGGHAGAARRTLRPVLEGPEQQPWVMVFAHGVAVAAARDRADLAGQITALEELLDGTAIADKDLYEVLARAARSWTGREPGLSARLWVLADRQARALDLDRDEVAAALVETRIAGAAIPLGSVALHREIGRGGMGQVWLGTVAGTRFEVAVKVLSRERGADPRTREALARELRAVASLDHPHIVPLVDHGEVPEAIDAMTAGRIPAGTPWLATRWAPGGSLAAWRASRPWPRVREVLLQVLDALGAAHARGLVHLDVKPANVLVAHEDDHGARVWLSDFGVARALGRGEDDPVAGTPAYMAPEQCLRRQRQYGPWTDLYALGGLAVALVQGAPPFTGGTADLLQQQVSRAPPPQKPAIDVPERFEAWCRRLLAKDPAERFRCAADAAVALETLGPAVPGGRPGDAPWEVQVSASSSSTFVLDEVAARELPVPTDSDLPATPAPMSSAPPALRMRRPPPPALAASASRLLPVRPVPLVGREHERTLLWDALAGVRDGGVGVVVLDEAAGAGSSRVLWWLVGAAAQAGAASVVRLEAWGGDPLREALHALLSTSGLDAEALEARLPRLLATHLGADRLGDTERGLLVRALQGDVEPAPVLLRLVEELSASRPVLVAVDLEDDGRVGATIARLATAMAELPVLVVCARPPVTEGIPASRLRRVSVGPVSDPPLARLSEALLPLSPALRDRVVDVASGDADQLVWTLRGLMASRSLRPREEGLVLRRPGEALPESRAAAVRRLLDPLVGGTPAHRRRLQLAAVLGQHVRGSEWSAACEVDGVGDAGELADALASRGLWRATLDGWVFADETVCAEALGELSEDDLRARHRVTAEVVGDVAQRASHLVQAGRTEAALQSLREGMRRWLRSRPDTARALAVRWRQLAEQAPIAEAERVWGEVLTALVEERFEPGAGPQLLSRARAVGPPDLVALASLLVAHQAETAHDLDGARAAAGSALSVAESTDVQRLARFHLGVFALDVGQLEEALEHLGQATSAGEAEARSYAVTTLLRMGELEAASRWATVARPAVESGSAGVAVGQLLLAVEVAEALGHHDLVDLRLREARVLGRAVSDFHDYIASANAMMVLVRRGDHDGARRHLADLGARHPERSLVRLASVVLEPELGASVPVRLARVRSRVEGVAWGVDHEEIADLLDRAATLPPWRDVGHDVLCTLARDLRARSGRAVDGDVEDAHSP